MKANRDVAAEPHLRLRPIHRLRHIPHELRQVGMAQHLPDGVGFADVEPVGDDKT